METSGNNMGNDSSSSDAGEGPFLLFGMFAWPAATDSATGTVGVPLVDGVGEPAARAADAGVGFGELVGGEGAGLDSEAFGDFGETQVCDGHVSPSFRQSGRIRH